MSQPGGRVQLLFLVRTLKKYGTSEVSSTYLIQLPCCSSVPPPDPMELADAFRLRSGESAADSAAAPDGEALSAAADSA